MADMSTTSAAYEELMKRYTDVGNSEYESKYQGDIDTTVNEIKNTEDFNYDSSKDASFQAAKSQYEKGANQAMKNTLAASSALTGGYANSWATTAAQQAYDGVMKDIAASLLPQYEEKAYSRHQDKLNQNYNLVSLLSGLDDKDYGRYSDGLTRDQTLLSIAAGIYDNNRNFDYQKERDAVSDAQYAEQFAYQKEQDRLAYEQNQAAIEAQSAAANAPTNGDYDGALRAYIAGGKNGLEQYILEKGYSGSVAEDLINYAVNNYSSASGNWTEDGEVAWNDDGTATWKVDGEYVTLKKGVNPYTQSVNRDIDNGALTNGYQPNNVDGEKLSSTGKKVPVYGRDQNVWQTQDGTQYVWIGRENKYITLNEYYKTYGK